MEPSISLTYSSGGGNGVVGMGFAISRGSAITRCPSNLAQDGEIREVRYDEFDKLCLDGKPLVVVGKESGIIEYRTKPDTHTKIIGQDPENTGTPKSFEAFLPSGLSSRPRVTWDLEWCRSSRLPVGFRARTGRGPSLILIEGWCRPGKSKYVSYRSSWQPTRTKSTCVGGFGQR
ncbi:MAG: hypothetical protein L6Q76_30520 [Polyangiaceae bacterium]|nr:hypothetical protein [Polyangiaceae bacterium]